MAYEVIILGHLHMPLYFLGTFTEYPILNNAKRRVAYSSFRILNSHPQYRWL